MPSSITYAASVGVGSPATTYSLLIDTGRLVLHIKSDVPITVSERIAPTPGLAQEKSTYLAALANLLAISCTFAMDLASSQDRSGMIQSQLNLVWSFLSNQLALQW